MELDSDLAKLLTSFNKLDNYVSKYIYNKYIKKEATVEVTLAQFLSNIINIDRPSIITQKESLETDLQNMEIADEEYDKDPVKFKIRQFDSLPDIKRCSFIRKHKNKYKRCANGIINDDSDMCYKHIESKNMYWDSYCKALEEIKNH